MEYETPGTALTVLTTELNRDENQSVARPETVELKCLTCGEAPFTLDRHFRSEGRTTVRYECVNCGNPYERDVTLDGADR